MRWTARDFQQHRLQFVQNSRDPAIAGARRRLPVQSICRDQVFRTVPLVILAILVALLAAFALCGFGIPDDFAGRTRRRRLAFALPLAGLVLFFVFQAVGCGSGGGGGGGTPAGTYTITVTGNGGGSTSNATVTLIVN